MSPHIGNNAAGGCNYILFILMLFGTAKKKTSEELGEAWTVWETLKKELDSCKCILSYSEILTMSCLPKSKVQDNQNSLGDLRTPPLPLLCQGLIGSC